MRHFIPSIIFSIVFTLLFPFSLIAQETEYKVPEHSMSYLTMAQGNNTTQPSSEISAPDTTLSVSDRQVLEPEFERQTKEAATIEVVPEPDSSGIATPSEPTKAANTKAVKTSPTKKSAAKVTEKPSVPTPVIATPATTEEPALSSASEIQNDSPLFSAALSKMQQNKAQREAEAARLGIVLPSQGGDMAAVSPSLSKIQQTLKNIMAR